MRSFIPFLITLVVLLSFFTTTHASSIRPSYRVTNPLLPRHLEARTDVCLDAGSTKCNITGANFCCPSSTECIPLENNTSVICCKVGEVCDEIHPISCPAAATAVVAMATTKQPPKCGNQCCPLGFECDPSGTKCLMKAENLPDKYKPTPTPSSAITAPSATATATGDHKSTTPLLGSVIPEEACPEFPVKAVLVGFFPGIVAGALLLFLWMKFMEARTRRRSIKSFGQFASFPSSDNIPEKPVTKKPSFPHGFVTARPPAQDSGYNGESTYSPLSSAFRSPDLGPIIPPLNSTTTRSSREPTPNPDHFTQLAPRPANRRDTVATSIACSEIAVVDYTPTPITPLKPKRRSFDTGYSASVYNDGNENRPFVFDPRNEVSVPPIPKPLPLFARQGGGPLPRPALTGWQNRV
ncbi:hypothetical protein FN846DRAFT_442252 [Sphaerosporella brunnea]|uniref:Mid2 domain-containing protein n=1 Tax=Sphaerosporella brunnea TaxID=1250544 RepID=A0A5J5EHF4_9PEZI|nr:hypothetical protein FN846DRAFT_442252 [Sphaerosporella brunnea]